ncbi:MAG: flagellar biosynthesis anti-sigma factor FlgM [Gemmatimonadaceae bacterium]
MKIPGGNTGPLRSERAREVQNIVVDQREQANKRTLSQIEQFDRVEISDAGRAKASPLEPTASGENGRLAEVRRRVMSGAYDVDGVVGEVARRILDRGDV